MWTIVLLGLTALFATGSATEIQLSIEPDIVAPDSDVTVGCRVIDPPDGAMVSWYKKQGTKAATTIGFSTFLVDDAFKNTNRFSIIEEKEESGVHFVMTISGVKQEDSGDYGCAISTTLEDRVYKQLAVSAPVGSVELVPITPFKTNEHELPIKEGEEYHMMCDVTGGFPAADVKITLAGTDITHRFDREEISVWETNPDESISNAALGIMSYNIKMTSNSPFKVEEGADDLYNREELVCEASVPSYEPVSDSLELVFMVAPTVTCKGAFVPQGERNVRLICAIRADPKPDNHNITWSWIETAYGTNYSLSAGEKTTNGQVLAHELKAGPEEDEHIAELYFPRVYIPHFTTYTLHVANTVGESTVEVELQRDEAREVGSGSSGLSATLTLLCITVMAAIFRGL